jgi:hypothetical protein
MAEQKQSDPIGLFIITLGILGGLTLIIDWSNFKDFGKTSTPAPVRKTEPVKRLQGFGPQCELDDESIPCMYRTVTRKESLATTTR